MKFAIQPAEIPKVKLVLNANRSQSSDVAGRSGDRPNQTMNRVTRIDSGKTTHGFERIHKRDRPEECQRRK